MTKIAGSGSGSISQRHGSADPDPHPPQNIMDPQHCFYSFYSLQCQLRLLHLSCPRVIGDKIFNILDSTGTVPYMIFWKKVKFTFTFGWKWIQIRIQIRIWIRIWIQNTAFYFYILGTWLMRQRLIRSFFFICRVREGRQGERCVPNYPSIGR